MRSALVILAALLTSGAGHGPTDAELALQLLDPAKRDAAACTLITRGRLAQGLDEPEHGCRVKAVLRARPGDAKSNYVVLLESSYLDEQLPPTSGHFELFDSAGRWLDYRANYLTPPGRVAPYRADGSLAAFDLTGYAGDEPPWQNDQWDVDALQVTPLDDLAAPRLNLILGPAHTAWDDAPRWSWELRDLDGNDTPQIQVGPRRRGVLSPVATYRFNPTTRAYDGPAGSVADGFLRFTEVRASPEAPCGATSPDVTKYAVASLARQGVTPQPKRPREDLFRIDVRETSSDRGWLYEYTLVNTSSFSELSDLWLGEQRTFCIHCQDPAPPPRLVKMEAPDGWHASTQAGTYVPYHFGPKEVDSSGPRVWPGESQGGFRLLFDGRCAWCMNPGYQVRLPGLGDTMSGMSGGVS